MNRQESGNIPRSNYICLLSNLHNFAGLSSLFKQVCYQVAFAGHFIE